MNAAQQQAEIANERPWEILGKTKAEWDAMPVNQHAHGGSPMTMGEIVAAEGGIPVPTKAPRKPRSDKGKPKPKPDIPGSEVVAKRIYNLSERVVKAAAKIGAATQELETAKTELQQYLDSLTAGPVQG